MTQYRYILADLLTNKTIAELELTNVNFTQALNSAGTFSGQIQLSGANASGQDVASATVPAKTALYVDRDGILVWGGIIWQRVYQSKTQTMQITAREFESYFERRRITKTQPFFQVDQFSIVTTLINDAQAATNGNIGIIVPSNLSGVLVNRQFYAYEYKQVFAAIYDLSRSTYGFDFNVTVSYDGGGSPAKYFELLYPRSGKAYSSTSFSAPVFEYPAGNVIEYEFPEDGSLANNSVTAVGAGSNEGKQYQIANDTTKLTAGWPLLEDVANYSDLTDINLLLNLAQGQIQAQGYPPTTLKMTVVPYISPIFGTYSLGDDARIRIRDDRFPDGSALDATYRIVAINVDPGEKEGERVTLTLTLPNTNINQS